MTKLDNILLALVSNCIYRKNVSPYNYQIFRDESIDKAKKEIIELMESLMPEKMFDKRGRYWNECRDELKKRIGELKK